MYNNRSRTAIITLLTICFITACMLSSCGSSKKLIIAEEPVRVVPKPFDPSSHFTEAGLRLYNMAKQFPFTVQAKMRASSRDSLQIRFIEIENNNAGAVRLTETNFQSNDRVQIEMGMMGKLSLAIACLQKIQALTHARVTSSTTMITEDAGKLLPGAFNDPFAFRGKPTVGQYLSRMLSQNDTEAYNRLFELVTKNELNEFVKNTGLTNTIFSNRLGKNISQEQNLTMNAIHFYDENNTKLFSQSASISAVKIMNKGFNNVTTLKDVETVLLKLFTGNFLGVHFNRMVTEEQVEYIKVLMANSQGTAIYDETNLVNKNESLFLAGQKQSEKAIALPLQHIDKRGMSEVLYFTQQNTGKSYILSSSIIFKSHRDRKEFDADLRAGRDFFRDLGKALLNK